MTMTASPSLGKEQIFSIGKDYPVVKPGDVSSDEPVKNVVYMIGDGMGFSHIFTAWVANKGKLNLDGFPVAGMARTWCADKVITDSAAAGTALACGSKTKKGMVGLSPSGERLDSLIVHAADMGKSTGMVVTCDVTDATPASFFAHVPKRTMAWDIASFLPASRIDFLVAGGLSKLQKRPDGRDILGEMKKEGYSIALDRAELEASTGGRLCAILAPGHLAHPGERGDVMSKAVKKGLDVLARNKKGFFMVVEGSKIDKAAHKNDLGLMMEEIFDFDRTIGVVLQWASSHPGTLVVVTADHNTGGLTLLGGDKEKGEVICHFSSGEHNEAAAPVFAFGAGAEKFTGIYENTDIQKKILEAMKHDSARKESRKKACHQKHLGEVGLEKQAVPLAQITGFFTALYFRVDLFVEYCTIL